MTSTTFDSLGYFEKLKAAGVPEAQAKAQVDALRELVDERLTTKADLHAAKIELQQQTKELETRLEIRLAELKNDLLRWVIGVSIGQAALIIAVMSLLR